jgi:predicted hydrocarbon binding protein
VPKVSSEELSPKFDPVKGELVGGRGEDYIVISAEALRRINQHEEAMLGTGSFVIWYNAGKAVGHVDGEKYAPLMQSMDIQEFASLLRDSYSRFGWGYIEYGDVDPNSGELLFTVQNSPLVRGVVSKEPRCWFVRGFVEGLISELLGAEVTAVEKECQAVNRKYYSFRLSWNAVST